MSIPIFVGYAPPPEVFAQVERFGADPANHKYQSVAGIPALDRKSVV